jgi:hypothetical protein
MVVATASVIPAAAAMLTQLFIALTFRRVGALSIGSGVQCEYSLNTSGSDYRSGVAGAESASAETLRGRRRRKLHPSRFGTPPRTAAGPVIVVARIGITGVTSGRFLVFGMPTICAGF